MIASINYCAQCTVCCVYLIVFDEIKDMNVGCSVMALMGHAY